MHSEKLLLCSIILLLIATTGLSQELVKYKEIDTSKLYLEVFYPENFDSSDNFPALIFFFGGGWKGGQRSQFLNHAKYFAKRGLVCFLVDYRIASKHLTTPFASLKDAKSAIRFIRKNSEEFKIDPEEIIGAGGSAGGHLAAATALIEGYNDSMDDLSLSCKPNALVLFNPVIDNGPGGYGYERVSDSYKSFSPLHNIRSGAPPTLFLVGTKDDLIPVETAKYFQVVMKKVNSTCELIFYEGQGHGFFNYRNFEYYKKTVKATDKFLQALGYLDPHPVIEILPSTK